MAPTRADVFEDSWSMDPAALDFSEFRNRHIWGPPNSSGSRQCINIALSRKPFPYSVEQRINPYPSGYFGCRVDGRKTLRSPSMSDSSLLASTDDQSSSIVHH
jgi:hypothetical protein